MQSSGRQLRQDDRCEFSKTSLEVFQVAEFVTLRSQQGQTVASSCRTERMGPMTVPQPDTFAKFGADERVVEIVPARESSRT